MESEILETKKSPKIREWEFLRGQVKTNTI